jgi:hypothetical protein
MNIVYKLRVGSHRWTVNAESATPESVIKAVASRLELVEGNLYAITFKDKRVLLGTCAPQKVLDSQQLTEEDRSALLASFRERLRSIELAISTERPHGARKRDLRRAMDGTLEEIRKLAV